MTRTRHLHRSAVIATATAIFAVAGAGTAALAMGNDDAAVAAPVVVEVVPTVVATAAENAAPAKATAAAIAKVSSVRLVAVSKPAAKPAAAPAEKAEKPAAKPAAKPAKKAAAKPAEKAAAKPAAKPAAPKTGTGSSVITIRSYVSAPGSQAAIDKCNLVLWSTSPLWLAAHNYCGYQWLAFVPTGKTVVVTKGAAKGTYVVTGHKRLTRQGGAMPRVNADLVLQTCVGSGTGLTLLQRV